MNPSTKSAIAILAIFALCVQSQEDKKDTETITKVVSLLEQMLEKSQQETYDERKIWVKFECFCDTNKAKKHAAIEGLKKQIDILESDIEYFTGDIGQNEQGTNQMNAAVTSAEEAVAELLELKKQNNIDFSSAEADETQMIKALKGAIDELFKIGADQSSSKGAADNKQFMAGFKGASLVSVSKEVTKALRTAVALMDEKQRTVVSSFLQAPFTGTYTSQSGQIIGILKGMLPTLKAKLETMRVTNTREQKEYQKLISAKRDEIFILEEDAKTHTALAGGSDSSRSDRRIKLAVAQKDLVTNEGSRDDILEMCDSKSKSYAARKLLRASEEAAISQAISILNSDASFATFGLTGATSTTDTGLTAERNVEGSLAFLQSRQLRSVHTHAAVAQGARPDVTQMTKVLKKATGEAASTRLPKVLAALQAGNAFDEVLEQIETMLDTIKQEQDSDENKLDTCNDDLHELKGEVADKDKSLGLLKKSIDTKKGDIYSKADGLLLLIQTRETELQNNQKSQRSMTTVRTEENVAYQKDIKNAVDAELILTKAVKVLSRFYEDLESKIKSGEAGLLQKAHTASAKPAWQSGDSTWKGQGTLTYDGQKDSGGDAITLLKFILKETQDEQKSLHTGEEEGQATYEDAMRGLKAKEALAETRLSKLQMDLADAEESYLSLQEDQKAGKNDMEATVELQTSTKADCKFILANFVLRTENRQTETTALNKVVRKIEQTPAYKVAENDAKVKSMGECADECTKDQQHVDCLACMNDVTVVAYCAGHSDAKGCA